MGGRSEGAGGEERRPEREDEEEEENDAKRVCDAPPVIYLRPIAGNEGVEGGQEEGREAVQVGSKTWREEEESEDTKEGVLKRYESILFATRV